MQATAMISAESGVNDNNDTIKGSVEIPGHWWQLADRSCHCHCHGHFHWAEQHDNKMNVNNDKIRAAQTHICGLVAGANVKTITS